MAVTMGTLLAVHLDEHSVEWKDAKRGSSKAASKDMQLVGCWAATTAS